MAKRSTAMINFASPCQGFVFFYPKHQLKGESSTKENISTAIRALAVEVETVKQMIILFQASVPYIETDDFLFENPVRLDGALYLTIPLGASRMNDIISQLDGLACVPTLGTAAMSVHPPRWYWSSWVTSPMKEEAKDRM